MTTETQEIGGVIGDRILSFAERIERLTEEKENLAEDIKEVYHELKGVGLDAPTVKKLVAIRKMETQARREAEELLDLYKAATGTI